VSTSSKSITLDVSPLTGDKPEDIIAWAQKLAENIVFQLNTGIPRLRLVEQHSIPSKPRDGDVVFADGTDWDPGSGQGYYGYYAATWHFLG